MIRIGNIGTVIDVTLQNASAQAVNLSTSTSLKIDMRKPDGELIELTGAVKNGSGTDGIITHTDSTGVFNKRGRWQARGRANFSGGDILKGSWVGFSVAE